MSWFDAAGFASLAKSALKEAQKTIDKALDIKDDENGGGITHLSPVDASGDDFFSSFGVSQVDSSNKSCEANQEEMMPVVTKSPTKVPNKMNLTSSLWGSFTGSFFESPKSEMGPEKSVQHTTSIESLADDASDFGLIEEKFSQSKLVVREISEDGDGSMRSHMSSSDHEGEEEKETPVKPEELLLNNVCEPCTSELDSCKIRQKERPSSFLSNRLSVISCDSGKNSSESVEILGNSSGTGCTTTPDSELTSIGQSVSTSSSTVGTKQTSESVEVLPDSLTSPSSIEILGSEATNSHRLSQYTDQEFISPFQSPVETINVIEDIFKTSPDSVEIIADGFEEEEQSIDDSISYMSASESTDATVLEQNKIEPRYEFGKSKLNMGESITSELSLSPDKNINIAEPITQAPSRTSTHLTLTHTSMSSSQPPFSTITNVGKELNRNAQILINTQPQGTTQVFTNILESLNVIDIPSLETSTANSITDGQNESNDEGSQSDKTLIADSECGGMESSTEENSVEKTTNSYYLKNMLADAMIEKTQDIDNNMTASCHSEGIENISMSTLDLLPREHSPISSESRSDLVKIGSEQTSGHTSGDELETATSSDIEIISSPNGDSSSAQSLCRHTPTRLQKSKCLNEPFGKLITTKVKGHNRELSEASSHSDDSHSSEIDRLLKRISEMTEILEAREAKLIDTTRKNAELQEINDDLKNHLDNILSKQIDSTDLNTVTEEYTQRMSALERKFQQAIREKDILRKQLEQAKQDVAARMSKSELELLLNEKDEIIKELREEGEKLSKQHLQLSNIIKKLRTKEKDNETTIKNFKDKLEELNVETERLKRSLTAKEDVERKQIDAVHQLTAKNKKLEGETNQLKSQLDDAMQKLDSSTKSLYAAKKELSDNNEANTKLQTKQATLEALENEKQVVQLQNEEVMSQLDDLRQKLRNSELQYLKKEQMLKKENTLLIRKLEDAEAKNEELAQSVSIATRPLIRQLESLQTTHSLKQSTWESQEQSLIQLLSNLVSLSCQSKFYFIFFLDESQDKLSVLTERERSTREECLSLRSNMISLETKLSNLSHQLELNATQLEQQKAEHMLVLQENNKEKQFLTNHIKTNEKEMDGFKKEITSLKDQLAIEKFRADELKNLQQHLQVCYINVLQILEDNK